MSPNDPMMGHDSRGHFLKINDLKLGHDRDPSVIYNTSNFANNIKNNFYYIKEKYLKKPKP